ncbi:S-layer homology domain-containing protein [Paenibacillus sp. UNC451MF]|uniref:S-layer homology domain-containing protein n=1 Tax=Paenibacillus sp. UNC451MF TaxID=1449063 RepID=UPI0018CC454B|nr:S-layer homology domain-containing protein [Paenibacillus sp. UNC451MF]
MNRLLRCWIFLLMLVLVWPVLPEEIRAGTASDFSLEAGSSTSELNGDITLTLKGRSMVDLYGYEAVIEFDESKLQFKEIENTMPGSGFSMGPIIKSSSLTFAYTKVGKGVGGESGIVNLSRITFKAAAPGTASIKLVSVKAVSSQEIENKWTGANSVAVVIGSDGSNPSNPGTGGSGRRGGGSAAVSQPQVQSSSDGVRVLANNTTQRINADGRSVAVVTLTADTIANAIEALKANPAAMNKIIIEASSQQDVVQVDLPALALIDLIRLFSNASLSIHYNEAVYDLPLLVLDLKKWADSLQAELKDVKISIVIEKVGGATAQQLTASARENGFRLLTEGFDFTIMAESGGRTITANEFGSTYVSRSIEVASVLDSGKSTGVLFDPATGVMKFVPTTFKTSGEKTTATMRRPGNSIYALVEHSKTFADMSGHWARQDIELLASKLIVSGRTDSDFVPEETITRAEFAALLVRGLGLTETEFTSFHDVSTKDWFAGAVGAAIKAGLADGISDDKFAPYENITREQMATMMSRAMKAAGKLPTADLKSLEAFEDRISISTWARESAAQSIAAGIMKGKSSSAFDPGASATRAEAVVVLKRMLQYEQFIN